MYQRILVPFDGSVPSTRGLDEAIKLARQGGAHLRLVHMVDDLTFATGFETCETYIDDVVPAMKTAGEDILEQGRTRAMAAGVTVDMLLLPQQPGRLCDHVVDQAKAWNADLIVIGTHGRRGARRLVLGSDAEEILRRSPVPVLVVRAPVVDSADELAQAGQAATRRGERGSSVVSGMRIVP